MWCLNTRADGGATTEAGRYAPPRVKSSERRGQNGLTIDQDDDERDGDAGNLVHHPERLAAHRPAAGASFLP